MNKPFLSRKEIADMRDANLRHALPDALTKEPTDPAACPKCGRKLGRGRAIHIKYCKGV